MVGLRFRRCDEGVKVEVLERVIAGGEEGEEGEEFREGAAGEATAEQALEKVLWDAGVREGDIWVEVDGANALTTPQGVLHAVAEGGGGLGRAIVHGHRSIVSFPVPRKVPFTVYLPRRPFRSAPHAGDQGLGEAGRAEHNEVAAVLLEMEGKAKHLLGGLGSLDSTRNGHRSRNRHPATMGGEGGEDLGIIIEQIRRMETFVESQEIHSISFLVHPSPDASVLASSALTALHRTMEEVSRAREEKEEKERQRVRLQEEMKRLQMAIVHQSEEMSFLSSQVTAVEHARSVLEMAQARAASSKRKEEALMAEMQKLKQLYLQGARSKEEAMFRVLENRRKEVEHVMQDMGAKHERVVDALQRQLEEDRRDRAKELSVLRDQHKTELGNLRTAHEEEKVRELSEVRAVLVQVENERDVLYRQLESSLAQQELVTQKEKELGKLLSAQRDITEEMKQNVEHMMNQEVKAKKVLLLLPVHCSWSCSSPPPPPLTPPPPPPLTPP
eukprot:761154-Hanusia_phi.AAC.1